MRQPRIKMIGDQVEGIYHCRSRTVNKERLFGDVEREMFRKQLWQVADFCGVQVLTYAVMVNHFHLLIRIPPAQPVSDTELLRRYAVLYPKPTKFQTAQLSVIRQQLITDGPAAVAWRRRMLALMGDVSPFMQLLKQRFSIWFNRTHDRCGTLWSERFGSTLLEPVGHSRKVVGAYVDLNAVRAGLTRDPLDYRYCGYAEAVAGSARARAGLMQLMQCDDWNDTQASYRQWLFGTGSDPREHRGCLTQRQLAQVVRERGQLSLAQLLRCRVRYFSAGAILGSEAFVASQLAAQRQRRRDFLGKPRSLPSYSGCADLVVLHPLRGPAIHIP